MDSLTLLIRLALRNLFASGINWVIGAIIAAGTFVVLVGNSIVSSMDAGLSHTVIHSAAGHLQVYSAKSKDDLVLWGGATNQPDLAPLPSFAQLKKLAESVPNIEALVPMGTNVAIIPSGNAIDLTLEKLREAVKAQAASGPDAAAAVRVSSLKELVQQNIRVLQQDLHSVQEVSTRTLEPEAAEALHRASSDSFWTEFDKTPFDSLELLENRVAPLASDAELIPLPYMGTDFDAYQKAFKPKIVDGQMIPEGRRGILLSKLYYEDWLKLKTARRLDKLLEAVTVRGRRIARDPELQSFIADNQAQIREVLLQLDAINTRTLVERLQKALGTQEADPGKLLVELFKVDDTNVQQRYKIFYEQVAPLVELYRIRVGDVLTIQSVGRNGYTEGVRVKVYGTFETPGLEKSLLAGAFNLMDLLSFRDLYGYMSSDDKEEIEKLRQQMGVKDVDRSNAEAALFGSGQGLASEGTESRIDVDATRGPPRNRRERAEELLQHVYTRDELENGVVLHAAVMLKDPEKLAQTMVALQIAAKRSNLPLKVIPWQVASGSLGQFVVLVKLGLFVAVLITLLVTLVVINNAIMMSTLQRVSEIGTLRAIGAQRGFVLAMVLAEVMMLGAVFGGGGALLGGWLVSRLQETGISATSDQLEFFFSGPSLHPTLTSGNVIFALVLVLVVSAASALYPAFLATRVSPLRAMQTDE